jgi:hypothetical protein
MEASAPRIHELITYEVMDMAPHSRTSHALTLRADRVVFPIYSVFECELYALGDPELTKQKWVLDASTIYITLTHGLVGPNRKPIFDCLRWEHLKYQHFSHDRSRSWYNDKGHIIYVDLPRIGPNREAVLVYPPFTGREYKFVTAQVMGFLFMDLDIQ